MKVFFIIMALVLSFFITERLLSLDLKISDYCFSLTSFKHNTGLSFAANLTAIFTIFATIYLIYKKSQFRNILVMEILLLVLVAPLLVNYILKPTFKRPRPDSIQRYNKTSQYTFVKAGNIGPKGRSFPSGHATMAFTSIFIYFLNQFKSKKRRYLLLIPGVLWGTFIGSIRILQGRHFLSDIIASFFITFCCCFLISLLINKYIYYDQEYYPN